MYEELLAQIQQWHEDDEFEKIVQAVEAIPVKKRSYMLTRKLASARNNLGEYAVALEILETIREEGKTDGVWHFIMGYSLYYLNREAEAAECFQKAIENGDDGEDTHEFLACCLREAAEKEEAAKRRQLEESQPQAVRNLRKYGWIR